MNGIVVQVLLAAVPAVGAILLHELAHGWAALALGDDTARAAGRLSLKPWRHVDKVGTLLLPGALLVGQLATIGRVEFMFGWAKPVPVAAWRLHVGEYRVARRLMMLVALAGPAMNFALAWLAAVSLHVSAGLAAPWAEVAGTLLQYFILYNLVLGLFNLLPVPPLDGGRVAVGLLPEALALRWARLERAGVALVLLSVFVLPAALRQAGVAFDPVRGLLDRVLPAALSLVLRLAGSPDVGF